MITPIEQLAPISGVKSAKPVEAVRGDQSIFGAVFQSAIDNVKQTDMEVREAQYLLSTGQLDNPAAQTIAAEKESIALDLLIQLRNKALDAYSEPTRISPCRQPNSGQASPSLSCLSICRRILSGIFTARSFGEMKETRREKEVTAFEQEG